MSGPVTGAPVNASRHTTRSQVACAAATAAVALGGVGLLASDATPRATAQSSIAVAAAACANASTEASGMSSTQIEDSVLCLVNQERASAGLVPVRPNWRLRAAALGHTEMMVEDGYFSHSCADGTSFISRIRASGYMKRTRSWLVGENLAWGRGEMSSPQSLVGAWMGSPPHRENLLRARFREVGIAAVIGTPHNALDPDGVTVGSDYGVVVKKKCRKPHK